MNRARIVAAAAAVGLLVAGVAGYQGYRWMYGASAKALYDDISQVETEAANLEREAELLPRRRRELAELTSSAGLLGGSDEAVNSRLRSALMSIGAAGRLQGISVTTSSARADENPARRSQVYEYTKAGAEWRADFATMSATLSGKGTLDQVVQTLATLDAQPWTHRIDSFALKPIGQDREGIDFDVTVTTMFVPGAQDRPADEPLWTPPGEEAISRWGALAAKNVFKEPPPPPPPAPVQVPADPTPDRPPPPTPYPEWVVTGIVVGASGTELWLRNSRSGEFRRLSVGEEILGAVFEGGEGETARIRLDGTLFEVRLMGTLADRSPVNQ